MIKTGSTRPLEVERLAPRIINPAFIAQNRKRYQGLLSYLTSRYLNLMKQLLQIQPLISLTLRTKPNAISSRMPPILNHQNPIEQAFTAEQFMLEASDRAVDGLLILGGPGAGKSTLLLQVALHFLHLQREKESYLLLFGVFQSVSVEALPEKERTTPNQGIRSSASNGQRLGSLSGCLFAVVCIAGRLLSLVVGLELGSRLNVGLVATLFNGLFFGIAGGMLVALLSGWLAYWQHWILRPLLQFRETLPWHTGAFLDQATRYVWMYRVGGGFRFFHPLFQDYVASLDSTTSVEAPASSGK
jgi:hypothetical protein